MTIGPEAQAAAKWWADQLRGTPKLDNGDDSHVGGMTAVLAVLAQASEPRQETTVIDEFEQALAEYVQRSLDRDAYPGCTLSTDYGPDYELSEVARSTGTRLSLTNLPWKTVMWIKPGKVTVSCGYRAPSAELPLPEAVASEGQET